MHREELRLLRERQLLWAQQRELDLDERDCTSKLEENLYGPLSPETRMELEAAHAGLFDEAEKSGGLRCAHSTAALVCNVFDYWRGGEIGRIAEICCGDPRSTELRFAQEAPTGVEGLSAGVDVLLGGGSARPTAVVAHYTEAYASGNDNRLPASVEEPGAWGPLSDCRNLALDLRANPRRYGSLDVARMLGVALGFTNRYGVRGFRLLYLWYEVEGHAADHHRREIDRFRMRAGGELDLEVLRWRDLHGAIESDSGTHAGYADYLTARYFPS